MPSDKRNSSYFQDLMNVKSLVLLVFSTSVILNAANLYYNNVSYSGFITNEWLINYQGGFVRRGLPGELILQLHRLSGIPPWVVIQVVQTVLYTAVLAIALIRLPRNLSVPVFLFVMSPVGFLFEFYDPGAGGRKEMLFLLVIGLNSYFLQSAEGRQPGKGYVAVLSTALALCVLSHEVAFFFILVVYLQFALHGVRWTPLTLAGPLLLPLAAFLVAAAHPGTEAIFLDVTRSLTGIVDIDPACGRNTNAICYLRASSSDALADVITPDFHKYILISLLLIAVHCLIFMGMSSSADNTGHSSRVINGLLLVGIVGMCLPLFVLGTDYGRWIRILVVGLFFSAPAAWYERRNLQGAFPSPLVFLIAFLVSISWNYIHTRKPDLSFGVWEKYEVFSGIYERYIRATIQPSLDIAGKSIVWKGCELPTASGVRTADCGVTKKDVAVAGHLVFGPYERLPAGSYTFDLAYESAVSAAEETGKWDIATVKDGKPEILALGTVQGTEAGRGALKEAFIISPAMDMLQFEIRIYSLADRPMTINTLTITRTR